MKLIELIKKFLGIKQEHEILLQPEDILTGIMSDSLALNMEYVSGKETVVEVNRIRPELFVKFLDSVPSGYVSCTFSGDDVPCSMLILAADQAARLVSMMRQAHSGLPQDEGAAMASTLEAFEGSMFHLFLPQPGQQENYLRLKGKFNACDHESMIWRAADSVIACISCGDITAYIMVAQERWTELCFRVKDKDYAWRMRGISVTEYTGNTEYMAEKDSFSIDISKPKEFLLGRFFLPARIKIDETRISSSFRQVSAGEDWPAGEIMKVSLDIKAGDETYRLWYGFEGCTLSSFAESFGPFDALFKGMLRDTVAFIKSACPEMKIAGLRYNASAAGPAGMNDCVFFRAELKINFIPVNVLIAVPVSFINLAAFSLLSPWEINLLRDTLRNRILAVLSVNSALFSRGISTFINTYRGGDDRIPVVTSCLPFYEFAELLNDADLRIVAQNFILPRFSSGYMRLFSIAVPAETGTGGKMLKIYRVESGIDRFRRFLPRAMQSGDPDDKTGWTEESMFDELNRDTMLDLYNAVAGDRLVLSAKAGFILKNQFFDVMQQEYGSLLEKLIAAGEPYASLEGVPYNVRQLAVTRVPDRELALAIMDSGDKMLSVTPLLSRARKDKVLDELDIARKQYREGRVTPGEIVKGIMAVKESIENEKKRSGE